MMDVVDKKTRSRMMSGIRGKNTKPEILVRKYLHSQGLRYSLHRQDLPGKPDIVLLKYKTVILVHGCYWHRHEGCKYTTTPKSNTDFWLNKFAGNVERDRRNQEELAKLGWKVIVFWECEAKDNGKLRSLVNSIKNG